jgi:hypothetical protein
MTPEVSNMENHWRRTSALGTSRSKLIADVRT